MQISRLSFENPLWLIIPCLLIGLLYAFVLYQKSAPWSIITNRSLALVRFVLVSTLCLLLFLNPFFRQITNVIEKPTIVFAIDNSESVSNIHSKEYLAKLLKSIEDIRLEVIKNDEMVDFQVLNTDSSYKKITDIGFENNSTNLSTLLNSIQNNYDNRNLDKVILISDGIFNQGSSPVYQNYNFPIYTVALGDTTPQRDIKVLSVLANKIAYLGNQFPILVDIENIGFPNKTVTVTLSQDGQILDKKNVTFKGDRSVEQISFNTIAKQRGITHYVVTTTVLEGEFTEENNRRDVFVEVLEGKQRILLAALNPHPDLKALKTAILKNDNIILDVFILGTGNLKPEKYDLVIFHQIPNIPKIGEDLLEKFKKEEVPIWYILGTQTNVQAFNSIQNIVKINLKSANFDKVTPFFSDKFSKFTFPVEKAGIFKKLPPLSVPFGEYQLGASTEVILKQKIGNVESNKPLLFLNQAPNNSKIAVLAGEGIWQWRMEEYNLTEKQDIVDELINKLIQFLTAKDDRRHFRVFTTNNEYFDFETVVFETEMYNDIYERIFDIPVSLKITGGDGFNKTYQFTPSINSSRFEVSGLKTGVYSYTASALVRGKQETSSGQFTIKRLQLEAMNTTADHNLLKQLSDKSKGEFFLPEQIEDLKKKILQTKKPNVIHTTEDMREIIHLYWIFFIFLALATIEWSIRKYQGAF